MNVTVKKEDDSCILMIEGRIDTLTAPELEKIFQENSDGCSTMIFEMSGVEYISSAGIRVLVSSHRRMEKEGILILKGICPDVLSILKMTGLDNRLNVEP